MSNEKITWASAASIGEKVTQNMIRNGYYSQPKPRNKAMGFRGEERPRGQWRHIAKPA